MGLSRGTRRALIVYILIGAVLLGLVYAVAQYDLTALTMKKNPNGHACNMTMRIVAPGWSLHYVGVQTANITVASFLDESAAALNVSVTKEYWTGYKSYFVTGIDGLVNGADGRFWQYYVNGEFPMVGCSQYILQDNDRVEWRFERPSWEP